MTRSDTRQEDGRQNGRTSGLNNASFTDSTISAQPDGAASPASAVQTSDIAEAQRVNPDQQPAPKGKMPQRHKRLLLAALGVGAIVAGIFGFRWWQYASTHEETDDAFVIGHIHPVSSRVNGTVIAVLVDDNEQVQQGEILARLDPRDLQNQVRQAQAALSQAQRQAETASSQTDTNLN